MIVPTGGEVRGRLWQSQGGLCLGRLSQRFELQGKWCAGSTVEELSLLDTYRSMIDSHKRQFAFWPLQPARPVSCTKLALVSA